MRNSRLFIAAFGLVSSLFVVACGNKDDAPAIVCKKFDYATYMPASTTLTLTADIAPIITATCATAKICHGRTASMMADHEPQLGIIGQDPDAAGLMAIRAALVGVPSKELPSMQYVNAGKPEDSWVMKKLEDSQGCDYTCNQQPGAKTPCGDRMPSTDPEPLPAAEQAKIRDWIKGGATL